MAERPSMNPTDAAKVERQVSVFNRFETPYLRVSPDVLGLGHLFVFEDFTVRIQLPGQSQVKDRSNAGIHPPRAYVTSWHIVNGTDVPTCYWISDVDLFLDLSGLVSLRRETLELRPNAYDVVPEPEQRDLELRITKARDVAERAFDLWVRTLRWKALEWEYVRMPVRRIVNNFGGRMVDVETRKTVWIAPHTVTARGPQYVTLDQWNDVENSLRQGSSPPVYYDLYFDACEHLEIGDARRACIDLAIACETFLGFLVASKTPQETPESIREYVERANIRQVCDNIVPPLLTKDNRKIYHKDIAPILAKLFKSRNDILHRGTDPTLSADRCEGFRSAALSLFSLKTAP